MTTGFGTLALSHETPNDRSGSSRWQRMTLTLEQHPLAVHGPNRQLGSVSVFHDRHMMGGNPLDLGGLADNVTALTRVLERSGVYW